MEFNIVSLNTTYKGICRSLSTDDLLLKNARTHYQDSINYYFKYLDLLYGPRGVSYNSRTFDDLLIYYNKFKGYGVECEMIVYDGVPLNDFFEWKIELLGIDIVHDFCESLLEEYNKMSDDVKKILNSNGLLTELTNIDIVLKNSVCGDVEWKPCWVYKVNL